MKKLLCLALSITVVSIGSVALAAGYCPSNTEFHTKIQGYQLRAMAAVQNPSSMSLEDMDRLQNEQQTYLNSIFPNCLQYFRTTQNPDCSRLAMLSSSYLLLDKSKQPAAKTQTYSLLNSLYGKCQPYELDTVKIMIK